MRLPAANDPAALHMKAPVPAIALRSKPRPAIAGAADVHATPEQNRVGKRDAHRDLANPPQSAGRSKGTAKRPKGARGRIAEEKSGHGRLAIPILSDGGVVRQPRWASSRPCGRPCARHGAGGDPAKVPRGTVSASGDSRERRRVLVFARPRARESPKRRTVREDPRESLDPLAKDTLAPTASLKRILHALGDVAFAVRRQRLADHVFAVVAMRGRIRLVGGEHRVESSAVFVGRAVRANRTASAHVPDHVHCVHVDEARCQARLARSQAGEASDGGGYARGMPMVSPRHDNDLRCHLPRCGVTAWCHRYRSVVAPTGRGTRRARSPTHHDPPQPASAPHAPMLRVAR